MLAKVRGVLVGAVTVAASLVLSGSVTADPPPAATFHGLTPARLADTRANGQTVDGLEVGTGEVTAGAVLHVTIVGRGGVPAVGVGSVALNVTAINPTAASFLTAYPAGTNRPNASNLNLDAGRTLPNMVIVPVGAGGQISIYNDQGATNIAVDVLGWFPPQLTFQGLTPARLADTRASGVTVDGAGQATGAVAAGGTVDVTVVGRGGVPASGVGAVALNVTAINPTTASFVTVYPIENSRPNASNLNLDAGRTLPNMVIVPVGAGGQVRVYNDQGSTNIAVDVLGWFPEGPNFTGLTPARLADTRLNGQTVDGAGQATGTITAGTTLDVTVVGRAGIPDTGVGAVALNVTAINPTAASFVTAYPAGAPRPNASNLNLAPTRTLPNMVIVPVGTAGQVTFYNDQGATHLAVDILGWFPTTSNPPTTTRVSVSSTGVESDSASNFPSISADGRYVTFSSNSSTFATNPTFTAHIYVHDRTTGDTNRVSLHSDGTPGNNSSFQPVISADGRYVTFQSFATNLVANDTNVAADIFVHDRTTATTTRVSVHSDGTPANGNSGEAAISADGRYITFESDATNLVAADTNGLRDIFVHDRTTGTTTRVSVHADGTEADSSSGQPAISADGRYITFDSSATNLVAADTNGFRDIFVHDRTTGATTRVSVHSDGTEADGSSFRPAISADARYITFESDATNLVAADTNGFRDIFVHDRVTNTTTRVSVHSDGTQATGGGSDNVAISADGRYITFHSLATDLVADDTNGQGDVFVHDRGTS